jgi:hypothetical protein
LELKTHQSNEIVARMLGFSDYQAMLRGITKVDRRIFEGKVLHGVASAHHFSGEDETCYLLGQILNLRGSNYFTVEMRGSWRRTGQQGAPETFIVGPSEEHQKSAKYLSLNLDDLGTPYISSSANELIASSPIFPEVLVFEHSDNSHSWTILNSYIGAKPFQSGIVSTGEGNRWKVLKDTSARTEYSLVYHVAISNTCATGSNPSHIVALLQSLRAESRDSVIVAWIFEDECSSGMHGTRSRERIVVPDREFSKDVATGWERVEHLGFVRSHAHAFFTRVMETLANYEIPFIRVPHYSGEKCFIAQKFSDSEPTPQRVRERDAITLEIIRQMEHLNLAKAMPTP